MADGRPRIKTHSILEDYDVKWSQKLGCGISGPVRPCTKKSSGERFALKCLLDRPRARQEVNLHLKCSGHPHIVNIVDVYENEVQFPGDPQPRLRLLLVMEMMEGGELFDRISHHKHFTERQAAFYTMQICRAIQRCHTFDIAHRDIKPENLLMKDNSENALIKLSDFGFAKVDDGTLTTPHFTPYYVAPQVLEAQKQQARSRFAVLGRGHKPYTYDKSCDMWSLGVLVYIMLCGYPPFYSETPTKNITRKMKHKIMAGQYEFPEDDWKHISPQAVELVKSLLVVDPMERLTVEEVMHHPWLREAPQTVLQSPAIMLDKGVFDEVKAAHSQQLTAMRLPDQPFALKALKQVNNPILKRRQQEHLRFNNGCWHDQSNSMDNRHSNDEPPVKQSSLEMATQRLRDIVAHCILPPRDSSDPSVTLNQLVCRACQCHSPDGALQRTLQPFHWDGKQFLKPVNYRKLAQALSEVIRNSTQTKEISS